MSVVLDSMNIPKGWTKVYISQIASYVRNSKHEEWYFGNKEQFEKRHKDIIDWIEKYEDMAYEYNMSIR